MAHLIRKIKVIERTVKGTTFNTTRAYVVCSCCGNQIYMPAETIGQYEHCYRCGAKFDTPVDDKEIKRVLKEEKR